MRPSRRAGPAGRSTRRGLPGGEQRGVEILRRGSVTNSIRRGLEEGRVGRGSGTRSKRYEGVAQGQTDCS